MKYLKLIIIFLLLSTQVTNAQKPVLKYNVDGKFKIIQITDTHFIFDNPNSDVVPLLLAEVIEAEKPDLLIFTGDIVWKNNGKTKDALNAVFAPVIERKIPWAYVIGNHDDEAEMSRTDIMDHVTQMPYSLSTHGDQYLAGVGNYVLEIKDKENKKIENILYCLDSHAYAKEPKGIGYYSWFEPNQVEWVRKQSKSYTKLNNDIPLPALAFFHIPLCEYVEMSTNKESLIGTKGEDECNGKLNTGMYSAMRIGGDVMGIFVGHDHDNDYIGNWYDIYLAYGRYSGGTSVYNNLGKNGCRIIELSEGKREFASYIRLLGGDKLHEVHYPSTFKKEKEDKVK